VPHDAHARTARPVIALSELLCGEETWWKNPWNWRKNGGHVGCSRQAAPFRGFLMLRTVGAAVGVLLIVFFFAAIIADGSRVLAAANGAAQQSLRR
jgi:hypothetical protein